MQLRKTMTREVIVAPPSLSVAQAWRILQREKIRHLPIVEAGRLVGIVSDRDLIRVGDELPSGELAFWGQSVAEIMTPRPIVASPSTGVAEAARIMTERKIDALPIVAVDILVGIVTSTDLLMLLLDKPSALPLPFDFRIREAARAA